MIAYLFHITKNYLGMQLLLLSNYLRAYKIPVESGYLCTLGENILF